MMLPKSLDQIAAVWRALLFKGLTITARPNFCGHNSGLEHVLEMDMRSVLSALGGAKRYGMFSVVGSHGVPEAELHPLIKDALVCAKEAFSILTRPKGDVPGIRL